MPVTTKLDAARNITIHEATGDLTYEDILRALDSFYEDPDLPDNVLWDGREATLKGLSREELEAIAIHPRRYLVSNQIKSGKRAILVSTDVDFGLSRVINIIKDIAGGDLPYQINVFRAWDDAIQWLTHTSVKNEKASRA